MNINKDNELDSLKLTTYIDINDKDIDIDRKMQGAPLRNFIDGQIPVIQKQL